MNDIVLLAFVLALFGSFVRACKQTDKIGVRIAFSYVFICVLLWGCIITTEANITNTRFVRYIGVTFRPGYELLAKRHSEESFGKKYTTHNKNNLTLSK